MTQIPLAYKFVAIAVMIAEINHCASKLRLPIHLPITRSDIKAAFIPPPNLSGFSGYLDIQSYRFSFPSDRLLALQRTLRQPASQRLRFITRLDNHYQAYSTTETQSNMPTFKFLQGLVDIPSTISTNDAYRIATNWLAAIDVDVKQLQNETPATVDHEYLKGYGLLPIFDVFWGKKGHAKIDVLIAGDTGDLLHLRQNDDSYSKRPFALIKNLDKLLAVPDAEFLKYSVEERSNLVARFSAVNYSQTNDFAHTNAPPFKK